MVLFNTAGNRAIACQALWSLMAGGRLDQDVNVGTGSLIDREPERRLLESFCAAAPERGGALLLCGEPGVGKTALLDHAAASTRARLLRARGVRGERGLPFATLADLLLPLRSYFRDIPRVQRTAIETSLALAEAAAPDPYAVCAATLNVLAAAGEATPTVVLVDDLQWVDPPSARALLFAARRLSRERVAMVLTIGVGRVDLGVRYGIPLLEVHSLAGPACAELLRRRGFDVAPHIVDELVRVTGGNPLALLEVAAAMSAAQLRGAQPIVLPPRRIRSTPLASAIGAAELSSSVCHGQALILSGRVPEGRSTLLAAEDALADADPVHDQQLLATAAQSWSWADNPEEGRRLLTAVIDAAHRRNAPAALPYALAARSELDSWAGRWVDAYADATDALCWAERLGQASVMGYSLACLARLDAVRGDRARSEERIVRARRDAGPFHIGCLEAYLTSVLGVAALACGEYGTAIEQLETTLEHSRSHGLDNPNVVPFAADLIEAHIRAGDETQATKVLDWLAEQAQATGLAWPAAVTARCRGLLAVDVEEADRHFAAAEAAHLRGEMPFEYARTQLCRGEVLRRLRQPRAARTHLTGALASFESLGAVPWARRATAELAATGQRPVDRTGPGPGPESLLTPQELQVARAVARGMNNLETANALFVSRKTVEAHLTRAYRKLGLRSRTDLTRLVVSAGLLD